MMTTVIHVRPVVASLIAWTLGALTAVGVGLLALSLIRSGLTDEAIQPLTQDAVADVTSTPPVAASRTATPTPQPISAGPTPVERLLSSTGGTVVARCANGMAFLVYWSPAQAYRVDDVVRGPAEMARVTFAGARREVKLSVSCVGDVPQADVRQEEREPGDE